MIQLDESYASIVITCTECTSWVEVEYDIDRADLVAMRHETNCHPYQYFYRNRVGKKRRQHAEKTAKSLTRRV